jgi:hypothetical protein
MIVHKLSFDDLFPVKHSLAKKYYFTTIFRSRRSLAPAFILCFAFSTEIAAGGLESSGVFTNPKVSTKI